MLPKKHRLNLSRFQNRTIFAQGEQVKTYSLKLFFRLVLEVEMGVGLAKVAVVVPKRIIKKAADRNRLRRQIYQAVAQSKWWQSQQAAANLPLEVVVLLTNTRQLKLGDKQNFNRIKQELNEAFSQILQVVN